MKNLWLIVLVICAMVASIAAAPMASSATLVGVSNGGGGPMFTFHVDGPVSLNGIVHSITGEYLGDFPMYCKQENETTVTCHTTKKLSGSSVTVEFGGSRFWVQIPEAPMPTAIGNCYNYYDIAHGEFPFASPEAGFVWRNVANICQESPAQDGDIQNFGNEPFRFHEGGLVDQQHFNPGPAYYMNAD